MEKDEIIKLVLELYSARKEAKEYLDFFAEPDEKAMLEKYKDIISKEFYHYVGREPKLSFPVCRKAIADFKNLKPSPEVLGDLMMYMIEKACKFAHDAGYLWESYYVTVTREYEKTLQYLASNGLWEEFKPRIKTCLSWAYSCECDFHFFLNDIFEEFEIEMSEEDGETQYTTEE